MKVSELQGALLDLWVARAEKKLRPFVCELQQPPYEACMIDEVRDGFIDYSPSRDWSEGDPILESKSIGFFKNEHGEWVATMLGIGQIPNGVGPTPLIAAMRAYIWMICGDEVPDEATNT